MRRRILIVGGGSAGITTAARLRRAGEAHVTVIEPSSSRHYQPLWTLVGGGLAELVESERPQAEFPPFPCGIGPPEGS